jgi:XTP/dITP diphosphohydrolase
MPLKKLVLATANEHKVAEIKPHLPQTWQVLSLTDIQLYENIPEPFETIPQNAAAKAKYVWEFLKKDENFILLAEDSGLCVPALGGEPGVHSAHYAGKERNNKKNIEKLILNLKNLGLAEPPAYFTTVMCCIVNGKTHFFEGQCNGKIISEPIGNQGFGYDPIFIPDGSNLSFAQMNSSQKSEFSHRQKALQLWLNFTQLIN